MTLRKFLRFFKHFGYYTRKDWNWLKDKLSKKEEEEEMEVTEVTLPTNTEEENISEEVKEFVEEKLSKDCYMKTSPKGELALYKNYKSGLKKMYIFEMVEDGVIIHNNMSKTSKKYLCNDNTKNWLLKLK